MKTLQRSDRDHRAEGELREKASSTDVHAVNQKERQKTSGRK